MINSFIDTEWVMQLFLIRTVCLRIGLPLSAIHQHEVHAGRLEKPAGSPRRAEPEKNRGFCPLSARIPRFRAQKRIRGRHQSARRGLRAKTGEFGPKAGKKWAKGKPFGRRRAAWTSCWFLEPPGVDFVLVRGIFLIVTATF